ncbi:SDR family oxidoreductase [Amylibacter sp. SFDW26]|uniref:SDR family oxidoreductase n=1 Tax=Amylibacter sp. SFDW26 TaxID=2652722 RepID=UPI0012617CC6|nr:SDR family oxidoreductase [Amylibacter sp. SFDW26]KAB7613977.1 SDR family oxidoreductase [Amylibacter sp. SFDW26]
MAHKAALITGGAHRLGREMALALAADGIAVAVHYSASAGEADKTVEMIKQAGGHAVAVHADLLDMEHTETLISRATDALDMPLDVLVNNASIFEYDTIETLNAKSWERHINSNLRASVFLTQAFAEQLPERGDNGAPACVVNMVDQRVRKLTPMFMTYTIAKAGLWAFTQTSAQALAPNVRVNAIGPGPTVQGTRQSKEHFDKQRAALILEEGPNPEDIVAALRYLLSAGSVTGQLICVDGGQHIAWQTPDIIGV